MMMDNGALVYHSERSNKKIDGCSISDNKKQKQLSHTMTPLELNRLRCQQPRQYVSNSNSNWNASMALRQKKTEAQALSNVILYSSQERIKNNKKAKNVMGHSEINSPFWMDKPSSDLEETPIF